MNLILLITTIALIGSLASAQHCNKRKEEAVDQCGSYSTLCLYPNDGPSSTCEQHPRVGYTLTKDEEQTIVRMHNELRRKVASGQEKQGNPGPQPPAISMPDLVWDKEIAKVAQRWAYQCQFQHDQCRNIDKFHVGQNIAILGTTADFSTLKVEQMVQMWYDEVKHFPKQIVSKFSGTPGVVTGHYTQMVWAKTTKIGCGAMRYIQGGMNRFYLVCNYGPAGNVIGQPIYETTLRNPVSNPKVDTQRQYPSFPLTSNGAPSQNRPSVPNGGNRYPYTPNGANQPQVIQVGANQFKIIPNGPNTFQLNSNERNPLSWISNLFPLNVDGTNQIQLTQSTANGIPYNQNGVTINNNGRRVFYKFQ